MSPAQIVRIPILPFNIVNAFFVKSEKGCVLVDTGIPGSEHKIESTLARHGLKFDDIRLIVVTHAHTDHAGSAARLRELSGAPIAAHRGDADFYSRRLPMTYCPTSWVGKLFFKTPAPHEPYAGFRPDILMDDSQAIDLDDFGLEGVLRHTAGHTPGHIAVELASRAALVGDLLASGILIGGVAFNGRAIRPPFEDDPQRVSIELERLVTSGTERFYLGHGGPLGPVEVLRHAHYLSAVPKVPGLTRCC